MGRFLYPLVGDNSFAAYLYSPKIPEISIKIIENGLEVIIIKCGLCLIIYEMKVSNKKVKLLLVHMYISKSKRLIKSFN